MKIGLTGSRGLVGADLLASLHRAGHEPVALVHSRKKARGKPCWDPDERYLDTEACENCDAFVHLAGENIASGRWTEAKKDRIRESRLLGTRFLAERLVRLSRPPKVFISASAIGYYGSRGGELLTEESAPGEGFLADLCGDWEAAADPLRSAGIRVVHLRIGVVLSRAGGALAKMLLPFRMGVGGIIGSGEQYMSCIALEDLVEIITFALHDGSLAGPINAVGPVPVTNAEFTKALGRVLGRPTVLPMPAFAARLAFGEMADELLLSSSRVLPAKLAAAGFNFKCATVDAALRLAITGSA